MLLFSDDIQLARALNLANTHNLKFFMMIIQIFGIDI